MSLNESIVENAALTWFGELGYAVGHGPHLAPGEQAGGTLTLAMILAVPMFRPADVRRALFSTGFWILTALLAVRQTP
ncbi:MAG: hypothetical protein ACYC23_10640 [Limisphaerales bacterium]